MTEKRQKKADFKKHRARTHTGYSIEIPVMPCKGTPLNPKSKSKSDNDGYRRLFEKQEQKHTIANTDF